MTPGLQAVMPDSGSPSFKVNISDLLDIVKNADEIAAVVVEVVSLRHNSCNFFFFTIENYPAPPIFLPGLRPDPDTIRPASGPSD